VVQGAGGRARGVKSGERRAQGGARREEEERFSVVDR
jgi:hypothetical protein